ncbi:hypothetical protein [Sphingomonas sp. Leaf25]|uniref:hypothetical protein n=1 Tax=Sphingomonas sp. Leaf25 TaxID=1735692 RepID=UPI0009EBAE82|nr:hypothetical protein [Sphingomonas sp. Leaf25]
MTAPLPAAVVAEVREAARGYLRIVARDEDGVIEGAAAAALALAEGFTGQALIAREHVAAMAAAGEWRALPVQPVRSITGGGAVAAVDIDANGTGWVRMAAAGEVRFVAGLAEDWAGLPPAVAQGVVLLAAHLIEARGRDLAPPAAVGALWRPWRRMRIGSARR